jgi:hypothetical protein
MYNVGEKISHRTFGDGVVESIGDSGSFRIYFIESGLKNLSIDTANQYITRYGEYRNYDPPTKMWYNNKGYNEDGIDREGYNTLGFNHSGFNRAGIHIETGRIYGPDGYTQDGYDANGFYADGIHKETGTRYDTEYYDVNRRHKSEDYFEFIRKKIDNLCELDFDGFYHMTNLDNVFSILESGFLYSRNEAVRTKNLQVNMEENLLETESVLNKTSNLIKDCVRLYFRPKTPTFYKFQRETRDIVLLKFDVKILCVDQAMISIGNAGKSRPELRRISFENLENIDFRTAFRSSDPPCDIYEKNMRHTEMLIPVSLSVKYLDSIIFMSEEQKKRYLLHYPVHNNVSFVVENNKFF